MIVYFENDGSYGQGAVRRPILVNEKPIGFVSEVTEEIVTCYLFDRYVHKEQFSLNAFSREQDIRAISIEI